MRHFVGLVTWAKLSRLEGSLGTEAQVKAKVKPLVQPLGRPLETEAKVKPLGASLKMEAQVVNVKPLGRSMGTGA